MFYLFCTCQEIAQTDKFGFLFPIRRETQALAYSFSFAGCSERSHAPPATLFALGHRNLARILANPPYLSLKRLFGVQSVVEADLTINSSGRYDQSRSVSKGSRNFVWAEKDAVEVSPNDCCGQILDVSVRCIRTVKAQI